MKIKRPAQPAFVVWCAIASLSGVSVVAVVSTSKLYTEASGSAGATQGAHLVEFSADVLVTEPTEAPVYGRFFRDSDGSTRLETGPQPGSDRVVSIHNRVDGVHYVKTGPDIWTKEPSVVKSHEIGVQMRRVKESDRFWKLAGRWRIDEPGLLVQASDGADGVDCYRMNGTNHVLILMPSLDWFPVIRENIFVGRREVYFNIRIEQDLAAELFLPPAGTPVIAGFEPRKRPPVVGQ